MRRWTKLTLATAALMVGARLVVLAERLAGEEFLNEHDAWFIPPRVRADFAALTRERDEYFLLAEYWSQRAAQ